MITTDSHVYFWRAERCFSNWHRTVGQFKDPVNDNVVFHSTEQAFMWWKAVFFQDHRVAGLVEKEADPKVCKVFGREIKGYDDKAWSCVRLGFMVYVCYLKFSQNPVMGKELLDTGNRVLVEASPYDKVWGVGLAEEDPLIRDEANWRGQNLLGKALMTVRDMLR